MKTLASLIILVFSVLVIISAFLAVLSFVNSGFKQSSQYNSQGFVLPLVPVTVFAQQGSGVWSLNLSDVSIIQTYVLPEPPNATLNDLYLALQNNLYSQNEPEKFELMVLSDGVVGNKTIVLRQAGGGDGAPLYVKFGYFVMLNGTIQTWSWRLFYNDSDLNFLIKAEPATGFGVANSRIVSLINGVLNQQFGTNNPTDETTITNNSTYFVPSRSWATQLAVYYGVINGPSYLTGTYQIHIASVDYSEAVYTGLNKFVADSVNNGFIRVYVNNTLIHQAFDSNTVTFSTWSVPLALDTTYFIQIEQAVTGSIHLLFLFR